MTSGTVHLPEVLGGFDLSDHTRYAAGIPYDVFARLRAEAPVLFHPPGRNSGDEGFWVVTGHADIRTVCTDPVFSAQGGGGREGGGTHLEDLATGVHAGVILAMMDDPRHDLVKRLLVPAVTGLALPPLEKRFRAIAEQLVGAAVAAGEVDFVDDISEPYAVRTTATLLGLPEQDWPLITEWVHGVLGFTNRRTGVNDEFATGVFHAMLAYAQGVLAAKQADPGDDLGSVLCAGELTGGEPLTDVERFTNLLVLLVTGIEQPRNTIAGGVAAFARDPGQWQALRADRRLLPGAVQEVLRWAPPNPYNRRTATRDVELGGQLIRAGEKVTVWWPSANRDESVYPDPSTFDIRRPVNPHVSFGYGTHHCLGAAVGELGIGVLLDVLADQVARIRLTGQEVHAPNNKHTVLLRMPVELRPA